MRVHGYVSACVMMAAAGLAARGQSTAPAADGEGPVKMTAAEDLTRMAKMLGVEPLMKRPAYNYDEAKANPFPNLPDPLLLKNGQKVMDAATWWDKRRPEIAEDFASEVYGRMPKETPKVTWEVVSTTPGKVGDFAVVTKSLVGHVDNASYPAVSVNIQVMLTTPADAKGPVPVMMQFSGVGFGFPGGGRGGPGGARGGARGAATAPATARSGVAATQGRGPATARGPAAGGPPPGPPWTQQLLAKGWGYALLNTGSVQADNGAGLTSGIIGLCNKGQPRKLDDWGVLEAWGWGASRALDYFETDKAVDAKQVGLEGHSRWGKATVVAMAMDQRFAIAYVSSSGEGGARLHRRNYGEPLEAVEGPEEYHWMAGNFLKYIGKEDQLPVDSHELIAMCAPRPVMVTGGTWDDRGVDARGMFLAVAGAGPVYQLLGKKPLAVTEMPAPNRAVIEGDLAFRQHEGGHSDAYDWPTFIEFASRYLHAPG